MKTRLLLLTAPLALLLTAAGCANASLDLTPASDPNRVINGTVNFRTERPLPPEAEVLVRVLDMSSVEQTRTAANRDMPVTASAQISTVPTVLAEQTVRVGTATTAVPFHLEFSANDELLRHGLNIEARISIGGSVRFRTVDAYALTLSTVGRNHEVWVRASGR
jgi:uncharacterized lipoprotein YbaY